MGETATRAVDRTAGACGRRGQLGQTPGIVASSTDSTAHGPGRAFGHFPLARGTRRLDNLRRFRPSPPSPARKDVAAMRCTQGLLVLVGLLLAARPAPAQNWAVNNPYGL